jgi:hypothetical protein
VDVGYIALMIVYGIVGASDMIFRFWYGTFYPAIKSLDYESDKVEIRSFQSWEW